MKFHCINLVINYLSQSKEMSEVKFKIYNAGIFHRPEHTPTGEVSPYPTENKAFSLHSEISLKTTHRQGFTITHTISILQHPT